MATVLLTIEVVSICAAFTRWTWRWHAGMYPEKGIWDQDATALAGHLFLGAIPPLGLAYVLGAYLHKREVAKAAKEKALEDEMKEAERLCR